jgi:hypothetical protein
MIADDGIDNTKAIPICVAPAKAGAHNHRYSSCDGCGSSKLNNTDRDYGSRPAPG